MTFDFFKIQYGEAFYGFINSELGMAMLVCLEKNDIANRLGTVDSQVQTDNAALFLGQVTGWRDAIHAIKSKMIVLPDTQPQELEANYERDEPDQEGFPPPRPNGLPPKEPELPPSQKPKRKRK